MKLTVFQSDKGDCLLVESVDKKRVLVDGGMGTSYREHVAPALAALRENGEKLDLIYVSHIDEDHIAGVLELTQAEIEWRVHEFQIASGNASHREPKAPRPPQVAELWHNAFHDQVDKNTRAISELLAATAAVLDAGSEPDDPKRAQDQRDLAASVDQGIRLSRRVGADQLKIPLNRAFDRKLALVRDDQEPIKLGALKLTVIGPFEADLDILRDKWNEWLRENKRQLERTRARMRADIERLATSEVELFRTAIELQAAELGDRRKVTAPNLASLMLLAEEQDTTVLLTGDGHSDDILKGLDHAGRLDADGALHVNVLKVQHHGAEFNIRPEFCRRVTADHYVFCANGAHQNPDLRALEAILGARLGSEQAASPNVQARDPFKLWFNSSSKAARGKANKQHMKKVEQLVSNRAQQHPDRLSFALLDDHSFDVEL